MSFRVGGRMKVWEIEPVTPKVTRLRLTSSKKNKATGEYEKDFSCKVAFVGAMTAAQAAQLQVGDVIELGDCEVTNKWSKDESTMYTNYTVFNFKKYIAPQEAQQVKPKAAYNDVESNPVEQDNPLPF